MHLWIGTLQEALVSPTRSGYSTRCVPGHPRMLVLEVSDRHHTEHSHGAGAAPRTAATNSVCARPPPLLVPIILRNTPSNRGGGAVCLPQAPRRNSEVLFLESSAPLSVAGVLHRIALSWSYPDICILLNRYHACRQTYCLFHAFRYRFYVWGR